jgi:formylglycine-generating enzyme required for sulfatase activity/tRNA A-37 threonylcarbamoyl transferase component Bud32
VAVLKNVTWLRTLFLSGMALGVEKLSEVAHGEHDPVRLAVAGGAVAFTTVAHYLVHRASEQHSEAQRELYTQRNHLVRRGMLAALQRALASVAPRCDSFLYDKLFRAWRENLDWALKDNELLDRLFPAEVFAEAQWQITNTYRPTAEHDAIALAMFLREWLTTDLNLSRLWREEEALEFSKQLLPLYQQAFADDLVKEGGALLQAFTVKGINEIRAFTVMAMPLLQQLLYQQQTGFAEIMGALRELRAGPLLSIPPLAFTEGTARPVDLNPGVTDPAGVLPSTIGTYEISREIGRGGFGTVFEARDAAGRAVALKRFEPLGFRSDQRTEAQRRFLRGARIMQRLQHPHIPRMFEVNTEEFFTVMELANHTSLDVFLRGRNAVGERMPLQTRVLWATQLAAAVQYAHDEGVLHRDISPSNVLVREASPQAYEVLLSDFDLAFQRGRTQLSGREWNWRLYLPRPLREELERLERTGVKDLSQLAISRPGIDADLYSLSMVILYLFTEYEPGPEGIHSEIERLRRMGRCEQWCSNAQLDHLAQTLERALLHDSGERFTSAEQIGHELEYLLPPRLIEGSEGMRFIPGGPFYMGSNDVADMDEYPRHIVRISDYLLDECLVTNADFKRFLGDAENKPWERGGKLAQSLADHRYLNHWSHGFPIELEECPVVFVSWHAALAYARWAGKRLVTEAEWEYAARAGTETLFWWGDNPDRTRMNYFGTGKKRVTPVRTFLPSPFGLYDMMGNVDEWCADWYDKDYYRTGPGPNPVGPQRGDQRVCRGGAYDSPSNVLRSSARGRQYEKDCRPNLGFRCARSIGHAQGLEYP